MGTFIEKGIKELYMYVLGAFVVGMAVASVLMLITHAVPEGNHDIVVMALGQLLGFAGLVVGYFYGSSKSSADKTELISGQAKPAMALQVIDTDPVIAAWSAGQPLPQGYEYADPDQKTIRKKS
ncbi:MAG: hypothetical protein JWO03_2243 [Bacteroidetes bacterium]|nr:hypothetical protein [Bacteroidota bacterium]